MEESRLPPSVEAIVAAVRWMGIGGVSLTLWTIVVCFALDASNRPQGVLWSHLWGTWLGLVAFWLASVYVIAQFAKRRGRHATQSPRAAGGAQLPGDRPLAQCIAVEIGKRNIDLSRAGLLLGIPGAELAADLRGFRPTRLSAGPLATFLGLTPGEASKLLDADAELVADTKRLAP